MRPHDRQPGILHIPWTRLSPAAVERSPKLWIPSFLLGAFRGVFGAAVAVERMESTIVATLNNDTECISAVHCLKVRLGHLSPSSATAVPLCACPQKTGSQAKKALLANSKRSRDWL
jgi:hypothetical protein